ncbi:MAG: hypothetical protein K6G75_05570 [Lachnospiraceae bacterium]|nr:hypothetical protein [Lachnospiraceae bacterium]
MNKKRFRCLCAILGISFLIGCNPTVNISDKDQNPGLAVIDNTDTDKPSDPGSETDPGTDTPSGNDTDSDNGKENDEISVVNNGSNFIAVGDTVYFRKMTENGLVGFSSVGRIMYPDTGYVSNEICCININEPDKIETILPEDYGEGDLYYYDGYIYSSKEYSENNTYVSEVYRFSLSDKKIETLCNGVIRDCSEDGRYLVALDFKQVDGVYRRIYTILKEGEPVGEYIAGKGGDISEYIAVTDESLYLLEKEYSEKESSIVRYDFETDKYTVIAKIPYKETDDPDFYMYTYPLTREGEIKDDVLTFLLHYCEDSGEWVAATDRVTLNISKDSQDSLKTEFVDEEKYYSLAFPETPESYKKYTETDVSEHCGFLKQVVAAEEINGTEFILVADCHEVPVWDMYEDVSYRILNLHYLIVPKGSSEAKEFYCSVPNNDRDMYARIFMIGEKGSTPKEFLYQMVMINGVESAPDFDEYSYVAEISDDFIYEHVPENGDIYDDFEKDDLAYFVKSINESGNIDKLYLSKLPDATSWGKLSVPNDGTQNPWSNLYVHISFDENGKICYMRPVIFD